MTLEEMTAIEAARILWENYPWGKEGGPSTYWLDTFASNILTTCQEEGRWSEELTAAAEKWRSADEDECLAAVERLKAELAEALAATRPCRIQP